jgi:hypothetical protein
MLIIRRIEQEIPMLREILKKSLDGMPIETEEGRQFTSGGACSRPEIEKVKQRLASFLAWSSGKTADPIESCCNLPIFG